MAILSSVRARLGRICLRRFPEGRVGSSRVAVLSRIPAAAVHNRCPTVRYLDCGQLYVLPGLEGVDFPVTPAPRRTSSFLEWAWSILRRTVDGVSSRRAAQESSPDGEKSP
jgi:hypothetical protein